MSVKESLLFPLQLSFFLNHSSLNISVATFFTIQDFLKRTILLQRTVYTFNFDNLLTKGNLKDDFNLA